MRSDSSASSRWVRRTLRGSTARLFGAFLAATALGCPESLAVEGSDGGPEPPTDSTVATNICDPGIPNVAMPTVADECKRFELPPLDTIEGRCGDDPNSWQFVWIDRPGGSPDPLTVRTELLLPGQEYRVGWAPGAFGVGFEGDCADACLFRGSYWNTRGSSDSHGVNGGFVGPGLLAFSTNTQAFWLCPDGIRP